MGGKSHSVETMATSNRRISDLNFGYQFYLKDRADNYLCLVINYLPLIQLKNGTYSKIGQLSGNFSVDWGELPSEIISKLETLERIIASFLPSYEINVTGKEPLVIKATGIIASGSGGL